MLHICNNFGFILQFHFAAVLVLVNIRYRKLLVSRSTLAKIVKNIRATKTRYVFDAFDTK